MKRVLVKLYGWSLHLYPDSFHQMFGDEMKETFASRLEDAQSRSVLIRCVVIETILLPVSVIREYHQKQMAIAYAGGIPMLVKTSRIYRWTLIGSTGLISAIIMLIILPFILHGIHQQPVSMVLNGAFDPKGFAPFASDNGRTLYNLTTLIILITPIWCIFSAGWVSISLIKHWRELKSRHRVIGLTVLLMVSMFIMFLLSPNGRVMFAWFLD